MPTASAAALPSWSAPARPKVTRKKKKSRVKVLLKKKANLAAKKNVDSKNRGNKRYKAEEIKKRKQGIKSSRPATKTTTAAARTKKIVSIGRIPARANVASSQRTAVRENQQLAKKQDHGGGKLVINIPQMTPEKDCIPGPSHRAYSDALVTYDEILASFAGAAVDPNPAVSEGAQIGAEGNELPPLPALFQNPGEYFRFVLADVCTPGKAPAVAAPEAPAPNYHYSRGSNDIGESEHTRQMKAKILQRAEDLASSKHTHKKTGTNSEEADTKVGKMKLKKKKKRKKKSGAKGTKKRSKTLTKKKSKKKVSKKKKKASVEAKPSVSDFKRALAQGTDKSDNNSKDTTGKKLDFEAIELVNLDDTEVNELVNTERSDVASVGFDTPHGPSRVKKTDDSENRNVSLEMPDDSTNQEHQFVAPSNAKPADTNVAADPVGPPPAPSAKPTSIAPPAVVDAQKDGDTAAYGAESTFSMPFSEAKDLGSTASFNMTCNFFRQEDQENIPTANRQGLAKTTPDWIRRKEKEVKDRRRRNAENNKRKKVRKKSGAFSTLGRLALVISPPSDRGNISGGTVSPMYTPWKKDGNDQKLSIASRMMMLKQKQRFMRQR
jgi:hypothetical protein